ncbi:winged helix-turn-helix transcriptional regulator [Amycolatopsis magusensis]|uniref:DNA-binding HxlR family transcriptional regulator n=1 Tax=Amycolatopsis magusensis TaxID=882444 RepID=A0ABS4PTW3_9PSEU|nr:helix-turn-helix domain-containing protein [Amycolatopsis magusensis]MBP2182872.1 DNA-binding HxlR family transcriptional regulator [Amycolatopsis magusensis]
MEGWNVPYQRELQDALTVLRGRWIVAVLAQLAMGKTQYKDLLVSINETENRDLRETEERSKLSERVLSDTLKRAVGHGLITREAEEQRFGAVWYSLTPRGRSLLRALRPLLEWSRENRDDLRATGS